MTTPEQKQSSVTTTERVSNRGRTKSDFPKHSLEQSLRIADVIENSNGGRPYPPTDTAIALKYSPGTSGYRILLSSSLKYGLTTGTYKSEYVALTPLGTSIVEPMTQQAKAEGILKAALTPPTIKSIYEYYRGKKIPDQQYFENTVVREFEIPREHAAKCYEVFMANMDYIGYLQKASTGLWLSKGGAPIQTIAEDIAITPTEEESDTDTVTDDDEVVPPATPDPVRNAIFIGHGKNRKPLEQLKTIFDDLKIPYKIAVDEANKARPISEKVAETMAECGAAILIFTADEEFRDKDSNPVWRPSENVVYELGAASIKYGGRIIIFKERDVVFPTNFRDIGHIEFEKDNLSAKMSELLKELTAFNLVRLIVG